MVVRYGSLCGNDDYQEMAEADDGAWVKYEDYTKRIAELEKAYDAILDDCRIQEKRIKKLKRLLQAHQTRANTPTKPMKGD